MYIGLLVVKECVRFWNCNYFVCSYLGVLLVTFLGAIRL